MHSGFLRDSGPARLRGVLRPILAVPVAAAFLSACMATSGDPCADAERDVDLFTLLDNSLSGTYDACLGDLRDDLARARLRARVLQGEADRLEAEAEALEGERAEAARRLAALNARQADALNRLEQARQGQVVDQLVLDDVLEREQELASELEVLNRDGGIDPAEAQRLEREQSDLMERIDALLSEG
ncbi:MAG: hypothetical protein J4G15_12435 [Alphaproteobacteria bacterium]|nr:hypothetical protein [Alphaproteobacteria bacterium]